MKVTTDLCRPASGRVKQFAAGLKRDYDAVRNGLTLSYSSGAVEGNVKIKMLKRQMFGRAKLDLLRKRVLLAMRTAPT